MIVTELHGASASDLTVSSDGSESTGPEGTRIARYSGRWEEHGYRGISGGRPISETFGGLNEKGMLLPPESSQSPPLIQRSDQHDPGIIGRGIGWPIGVGAETSPSLNPCVDVGLGVVEVG